MSALDATTTARFSDWTCVLEASVEQASGRSRLPLAVYCTLGSLVGPDVALWDTGALFSIISPARARLLERDLGPREAAIGIDTRWGLKRGFLRRLPIKLSAVRGADLTVDSTVLALDDPWEGPTVLGLCGFMDRLRFALDLGTSAAHQPLLAVAPLTADVP